MSAARDVAFGLAVAGAMLAIAVAVTMMLLAILTGSGGDPCVDGEVLVYAGDSNYVCMPKTAP